MRVLLNLTCFEWAKSGGDLLVESDTFEMYKGFLSSGTVSVAG